MINSIDNRTERDILLNEQLNNLKPDSTNLDYLALKMYHNNAEYLKDNYNGF